MVSQLSFNNTVLEVLASAVRQEKLMKGIQIGKKGIKLSLFADNVIICIENPMEYPKLLKLVSEFSKIGGYKSIHKIQVDFYIVATEI